MWSFLKKRSVLLGCERWVRHVHLVTTSTAHKGHRMEVVRGKAREGGSTFHYAEGDVTEFGGKEGVTVRKPVTYSDLRRKWRGTTGTSKKKWSIARAWRNTRKCEPSPPPDDILVQHTSNKVRDGKDCFAIVKSDVILQHKVVVGDVVQVEHIKRRDAGEIIYLGTVLMVGSKDFTWIGKPTVPNVRVKACIEQQTASRPTLSFRYKKSARTSRFLRSVHLLTYIRILDIEFGVVEEEKKPERLLDLWANRWLHEGEKAAVSQEKKKSCIEHRAGFLQESGFTTYRFAPDPLAPNYKP